MTSNTEIQPKFDKLLEYVNVNPQQQPNHKCEVNNKKLSVGKEKKNGELGSPTKLHFNLLKFNEF